MRTFIKNIKNKHRNYKKQRNVAGKESSPNQSFSAEPLEVVIQKIVPGGFGLAFTENLTVFVPLAAAGDRLSVRIYRQKGKTAFAEIVEILEPSPNRTEPRCPYFGRCGGCDFQQLEYDAQLEAKRGIIRDCLTRIGKIDFLDEIKMIGSPRSYDYRSRAQWHLDSRSRKFGYFQRKSHDVIDVEFCPILEPALDGALKNLRENLVWEDFGREPVEIEASSGDGAISIYSNEIMEPTREVSFTARGEKYFYDATSFFQGNPFLIEELVETALSGAAGETALDLYCGVGLFTIPLARKFEKVFGVEANEKAIDFAEKNAAYAGISNAEFFREGTAEFLQNAEFENLDLILLDPPRSGAEKTVIENLLRLAPKTISYVSCEPSVLARDLRVLCDGGYSISSITALDLFPQTHHVETIVTLNNG